MAVYDPLEEDMNDYGMNGIGWLIAILTTIIFVAGFAVGTAFGHLVI